MNQADAQKPVKCFLKIEWLFSGEEADDRSLNLSACLFESNDDLLWNLQPTNVLLFFRKELFRELFAIVPYGTKSHGNHTKRNTYYRRQYCPPPTYPIAKDSYIPTFLPNNCSFLQKPISTKTHFATKLDAALIILLSS